MWSSSALSLHHMQWDLSHNQNGQHHALSFILYELEIRKMPEGHACKCFKRPWTKTYGTIISRQKLWLLSELIGKLCAMKSTPTLKAGITNIWAESQNALRVNNGLAPIMLDSVLPVWDSRTNSIFTNELKNRVFFSNPEDYLLQYYYIII